MAYPIWIINMRHGEPSLAQLASKLNELVNSVNKLMDTVETQEKEIKELNGKNANPIEGMKLTEENYP